MNAPHSPLFWSFPIGSLFATRIRVSIWFPLMLVALLFRLDLQLGLAIAAIIFVSILFHELVGHVLMARATGGEGHEVLMWPFGGLAFVRPAPTWTSQFFTAAGGPLTHLLLCVLTLPTVLLVEGGEAAFYPFVLPFAEFSNNWGAELLLLIFYLNFALLLVNLLPIYPLDGGRMVEACLTGMSTPLERKTLCLRIGSVVAVICLVLSVVFDNSWLVLMAATLLILNILEGVNLQFGESYDDSFMGYDFSQGYTSLERSAGSERRAEKSFWQRRKERKAAEKARAAAELREQQEAELDLLLAKVHQQGVDSLTPQEKKFLERTSRKLRTKNG